MKSIKVNIKSGNYNKRGLMGSQLIQQQQPGLMAVTGSAQVYFDSMTQLTALLAGTDTSLEFIFTGAPIGTGTAPDNRTLDLLIPVAQITGKTPENKSASSEIMLDLAFTAWVSGAGVPNHLVQATLINSVQAAY
jgi:hypothetical protein